MAVDDAYTKLLLHCDGEDNSTSVLDETGKTVEVNGNTYLETDNKKFGISSLKLDGTGDYLKLNASDDWYFDADFTLDFWIYFTAFSGYDMFFNNEYNDTNNRWAFYKGSGTDHKLYYFHITSGVALTYDANSGAGFELNNWYHIALIRSGSTYKFFVNGIELAGTKSGTVAHANYNKPLYIGTQLVNGTPSHFPSAYMDEIRISKGIARWTENFTPPTAAYEPAEPPSSEGILFATII